MTVRLAQAAGGGAAADSGAAGRGGCGHRLLRVIDFVLNHWCARRRLLAAGRPRAAARLGAAVAAMGGGFPALLVSCRRKDLPPPSPQAALAGSTARHFCQGSCLVVMALHCPEKVSAMAVLWRLGTLLAPTRLQVWRPTNCTGGKLGHCAAVGVLCAAQTLLTTVVRVACVTCSLGFNGRG